MTWAKPPEQDDTATFRGVRACYSIILIKARPFNEAGSISSGRFRLPMVLSHREHHF